MEKDLKVNDSNLMYIPKDIKKIIGEEPKIIANFKTVLIFDRDTTYEDVLQSIDTLKSDVQHRLDAERREKEKKEEKTNEH